MNRLEKLTLNLCPNGVEFVILNTVCEIYDGTHQTPNYTDSGVKFVSVENIGDLYSTSKYISEEDYLKYKIKPQKDDVLMTRIGSVGSCAVVESNEKIAYYVSLALLRPNKEVLNSKYLKYAIESLHGRKELRKRTLVNAIPIKINMGDIGKITIPLPPLEVQHEIVRTLDTFTELTAKLTAELTAELTARKKQYEYYRNQLLSKKNYKYNIKKIRDIADIYLGLTHTPDYVENGVVFISSQNIANDFLDLSNIKYISESEFNSCTSNAKPRRGDILFTRVGSNLGHPTIIEMDIPLCIFVSLGYLRVKEGISNRYIKHWMNTELFWKQVRKKTKNAPKVNLNTGWIKEFDIVLPSYDIQEKISDILDSFEINYNNYNIALTTEIEARQKQYEYYRDKLLTFKELSE